MEPLKRGCQSSQRKASVDNRYKELLKQGINPERARQLSASRKHSTRQVEVLDVEIDILKAKVAQGDATKQQIAL